MYRVRKRIKGGSEIVAEGVSLKEAYQTVIELGKGTNHHFMIDKTDYKPFSNLTSREAKIRMERGECDA